MIKLFSSLSRAPHTHFSIHIDGQHAVIAQAHRTKYVKWKISSPPKWNWISSKLRHSGLSLLQTRYRSFMCTLIATVCSRWTVVISVEKSERNLNLLFRFFISTSLQPLILLLIFSQYTARHRELSLKSCSSWSSTLLHTPTHFLFRSPSSSTLSNNTQQFHTKLMPATTTTTTISRNSENVEWANKNKFFPVAIISCWRIDFYSVSFSAWKKRLLYSDFFVTLQFCAG